MADASIYAPLDLSVPAFAPRTRLFRLPPIGIGTPMVESLTSYITRLAEAHVVSPGALILKELTNFLPDRPSDTMSARSCSYSTFIYDACALNSTTATTERWGTAVEAATGRRDLRFLTMLPWKQAFTWQRLVRTKRAWCACCYQEWRDAGGPIYEPLHWMIAAVPICVHHREPLTEICPHCGRQPHVIACKSLPGHCSRCGRWLGGVRQRPSVAAGGKMSSAQLIAESVAELLAKAPTLELALSTPAVRTNLESCIGDLCAGNRNLFRRTVEIDYTTIDDWVTGHILPSLPSMLKVCLRLGVPLVRFVTELLAPGDPHWERARQAVSLTKAFAGRGHRTPIVHRAIREPLKAARARLPASCEQEEVLRKALRQDPPPTLREVSVGLGQHPNSLRSRFPILCRALVARSKEHRKLYRLELEKLLRKALIEEPPPTIKKLAARIGHLGSSMRRWFPDLHKALAARAAHRRDWWLNSKRSLLARALTEEPPPSGRSVAARVDTDSSYLRAVFPDLWHHVVARHAEYRKREAAKDRDAFREEVRQITRELLKAGKYPSRARVCSLIRDSKLDGAHLVVREVRRVLREFQG